MHYVTLKMKSENKKTGPIPVSTSERGTCPPTCPHYEGTCYAELGPLRLHWDKVAERGMSWPEFCVTVASLDEDTLWRHNQAGDLPHQASKPKHEIDGAALMLLVEANMGRRGFTFTHFDPAVGDNAYWSAAANAMGFTINLSADTPAQADEFLALGIGPVVLTVASDHPEKSYTPEGNLIALCPATTHEDMNCQRCGICATQHKAVIGFRGHGTRQRQLDIRIHAVTA